MNALVPITRSLSHPSGRTRISKKKQANSNSFDLFLAAESGHTTTHSPYPYIDAEFEDMDEEKPSSLYSKAAKFISWFAKGQVVNYYT